MGSTRKQWDRYKRTLGNTLSALSESTSITVDVNPERAAEYGIGDGYYMQFFVKPGEYVYGEAVGNRYLAKQHRLDKAARRRLVGLGFCKPDSKVPNYWARRFEADAAAEIARMSVGVLRDVYGIPDPSILRYRAWTDEGPVRLEGMGRRAPSVTAAAAIEPTLRDRVLEAVADYLKTPVPDLEIDEDGDVPIRAGSSMVFVSVVEDPALVRVFSPLVSDVNVTPALLRRINRLNTTEYVGRTYLTGRTVVYEVPMIAQDFAPSQLEVALHVVTTVADTLAERFAERFGGRRFFDSEGEVDEEALSAAGGSRMRGGYL